jgi:hypothetical protein
MSGIGRTGQPDFGRLEQLTQTPSGSLKVDDNGRFTTDTGMTFRSGLNRLFHQGKSQDVEQNKSTLGAILDEIKGKVSNDVYNKVLNSQLRMSGDGNNSYSVRDRLDRGSYVSGKLVGELLQITRNEVDKETERMRPFEQQSQKKINDFLQKPSFNTHVTREAWYSGDRSRILEDDYTRNKFENFISDNRTRIRSSLDEQVRNKARQGESLDNSEVEWGVKRFVGQTLLLEFVKAQPPRTDINEMTPGDIAQGARSYFERNGFSSQHGNHVDALIRKLSEGGEQVEELRRGVARKLEQDQKMVSSEELVNLLDHRKLNDLLSEQVRRS